EPLDKGGDAGGIDVADFAEHDPDPRAFPKRREYRFAHLLRPGQVNLAAQADQHASIGRFVFDRIHAWSSPLAWLALTFLCMTMQLPRPSGRCCMAQSSITVSIRAMPSPPLRHSPSGLARTQWGSTTGTVSSRRNSSLPASRVTRRSMSPEHSGP